VGRGIRVKLEVFKTEKCGWGVRAAQNIPQNTFIAEYAGEILDHDEAESRKGSHGNDSYFLETETLEELAQSSESGVAVGVNYILDAKHWGNVARFFNGSCSPNMVKEKVTNRNCNKYPLRLAFYASRDIEVGEELCWNYEYNKTTLKGSLDHNLQCHCGATNCCGVMF
jgi:SET domain-containing protein